MIEIDRLIGTDYDGRKSIKYRAVVAGTLSQWSNLCRKGSPCIARTLQIEDGIVATAALIGYHIGFINDIQLYLKSIGTSLHTYISWNNHTGIAPVNGYIHDITHLYISDRSDMHPIAPIASVNTKLCGRIKIGTPAATISIHGKGDEKPDLIAHSVNASAFISNIPAYNVQCRKL